MTVTDDKWKFYADKKGEWKWTRKAGNGEVIGIAHEGYKNIIDCMANAILSGYYFGKELYY